MGKNLKKMNQAIKNKAIWLFAGGAMQELAAKKIKELGYKLILTDRNPKCLCQKYTDELVEADTFDIKENLKASILLRKKYHIKAVLTAGADCHETVAHVAKDLGLHGINPVIAHSCRFKQIGREILRKNGIAQPKSIVVKSLLDAKKAVRKIGLPVVVKATNNSGSRGFAKIKKLEDLTSAVFERAVANGTTGSAIIEELLIPTDKEISEQSVETLWYNGKMYWLNWVDRLFRNDFAHFKKLPTSMYKNTAWGIELAHINPALHKYETKQRVWKMIERAGIALGMHKEHGGHILKADIMLTNKGPRIIELTPRLSGGWDSSMTTPMRGADFVGGAISLALGEPLNLENWHRYFEYKNPRLFVSLVSKVEKGADDCTKRDFIIPAQSFDQELSLKLALDNLAHSRIIR